MATAPDFLMPRQVPYAPMPTGLGGYGQQAYRLAGTPPQTQQRSYNLSGPLAPFATPSSGGSSGGGELAGLLGLLAQNPNMLSGITNAAKGLLGGGSQAQFPGSMLDTAQKAGSLAELLPGAVNPPMISPTPPLADPEIVKAIQPTAQIPAADSLAGLLSPSASAAPAMITPSAPTIAMNPAVDAAITQAGSQIASTAPLTATEQALANIGATAGTAAGGAGAAAFPGSMLAAAQSGAPLSALVSASAPSLGVPAGLLTPAQYATAITPTATIPGAAGTGAAAGSGTLASLAGPAAVVAGGLLAAQGISKGKEGQAALGGGIAGAGASLMGLGALGPLGLAGAAIAAIGASMVNTKEFGDVALRNYWNAVDSGRGIGETDPNELAQGFINFYRTNKNEFAPQAVYGRTGNETFMQDFKRQINTAIESGAVPPTATPQEIYAQVIQPWIGSMGAGPQDQAARAIQDHMLTDLVASYQAGKPISNAEVKGDRKFDIVSNPLRYPSAAQPAQPTPGMATMSAPGLDLSGDMVMIPPEEDVLGMAMQQAPAATGSYGGLLAQVANATPLDSPYAGLLSQWRTV